VDALSPLLPCIIALVVGHNPTAGLACLGALTGPQLLSIGSEVLNDAPDVISTFKKIHQPGSNGSQLLLDIQRAAVTGIVSANLKRWLAANERAAMRIQSQSIRHQR
jgi:hypothetical protein